MTWLQKLAEKLKEPSTWGGLGLVVTAFGWKFITPELWDTVAAIGMGIGGFLMIVLKERGTPPSA